MDNINVIVRKRPLINVDKDVIYVDGTSINVYEDKQGVDLRKIKKIHTYEFDKIYSETSSNKQIYEDNIYLYINSLQHKKNIVCYAYGQTGSGKTHTIFGDSKDIGLITITCGDMLECVSDKSYLKLLISSYEIYNNNTYDLLNEKNKVHVREGYNKYIHISGLKHYEITSYNDFIKYMKIIMINRNIGESSENDVSSRSHAIFQLQLESLGEKLGKITFIDLAGSERGSKSICNNRFEYRENIAINKSLLALKECIRSLKNKKSHIPFRSSKLTTVLRESFTNSTKTIMIGTISPEGSNISDSVNTLSYTSDVKYIKKLNHNENLPNIRWIPSKPIEHKPFKLYGRMSSMKTSIRVHPKIKHIKKKKSVTINEHYREFLNNIIHVSNMELDVMDTEKISIEYMKTIVKKINHLSTVLTSNIDK